MKIRNALECRFLSKCSGVLKKRDCLKMIAVVLYTKKEAEHGLLLYPCARGQFRSDKDAKEYASLFTGESPPHPYAGAGKRFGPNTFSDAELKEAKMQHMRENYSLPKDVNTFWKKDADVQAKLLFPLCTPTATILEHEDAHTAAVRALWEFTGVKEKQLEFVKGGDVQIFKVHVDLDKAKWEWMSHQAERLTLTDWSVCPYDNLLDELGVPKVVHQSYCQTHGGPRFVTDLEKHVVEDATKRILATI